MNVLASFGSLKSGHDLTQEHGVGYRMTDIKEGPWEHRDLATPLAEERTGAQTKRKESK